MHVLAGQSWRCICRHGIGSPGIFPVENGKSWKSFLKQADFLKVLVLVLGAECADWPGRMLEKSFVMAFSFS